MKHRPPSDRNRHRHGFTLMEVILAMLIVSIIGTVLTATLRTVTVSWSESRERVERLRQLQSLYTVLWYDFSTATPYPGASAISSLLKTDDQSGDIYMVRGGWTNPFAEARSGLQYVHYASPQKSTMLMRYNAPAKLLDNVPDLAAASDTLDKNPRSVGENITLRATVTSLDQRSYSTWPPPTSGTTAPPNMVTLHLEMKPFGPVEENIPVEATP